MWSAYLLSNRQEKGSFMWQRALRCEELHPVSKVPSFCVTQDIDHNLALTSHILCSVCAYWLDYFSIHKYNVLYVLAISFQKWCINVSRKKQGSYSVLQTETYWLRYCNNKIWVFSKLCLQICRAWRQTNGWIMSIICHIQDEVSRVLGHILLNRPFFIHHSSHTPLNIEWGDTS